MDYTEYVGITSVCCFHIKKRKEAMKWRAEPRIKETEEDAF